MVMVPIRIYGGIAAVHVGVVVVPIGIGTAHAAPNSFGVDCRVIQSGRTKICIRRTTTG